MALTREEIRRLQIFGELRLDRRQVETILSRSLTDREWKSYSKDYRTLFTKVAKQAAQKAEKKHQAFEKAKNNSIPFQAARKGARRLAAKKNEEEDKYHFAKSLFKESSDTFEIEKISEYYSTKYKTSVSTWRVNGSVNLFNIHQVIVELINKMMQKLPENSKIQIGIKTPSDKEPHTKLLSKHKIIDIVTEWVNYFMDYKDMNIHDLIFKLTAVEIPQGGKKPNSIINLDNKRSIIQISNNDKLCLVRSILVGLSFHMDQLIKTFKGKLNDDEIKKINRGRKGDATKINEGSFTEMEVTYLKQGGKKKLQTVLAEAFHRIYNITLKDEGNDFSDIKTIEEILNIEVQVYAISKRQLYGGQSKPTKIYLILNENHYSVISKLPAFLGIDLKDVKEKLQCESCKNPTQCKEESKTKCATCGKLFYSQSCLDNHITNNKCIEYSYVCQKCFRCLEVKTRKEEDHKCGERCCPNCDSWYIGEHKCYMQIKEIKKPSEKYIFYDFETTTNAEGKHIINYCIAQYFNGKEFTFHTLDEFCTWIFTKHHKNYTVIAHYGKGYDFQFVHEWLVTHGVKPSVILNGQKILKLEVKLYYNIIFIDSISFTMQPLKDFPKTFGLEELTKGYFPHEFNKPENQDYIGKYPDKHYYSYNSMTKKSKEEFDKWYDTVTGEQFIFKEQMYKYCKSDVDILRKGCLKLRELFMQIAGVDPFQYVTIASVCQAIYRSEFLTENTIGIFDELSRDTYSLKSIKWLKYISINQNVNIRHACNGGEQSIIINKTKKIKIDGFCSETNTVYQFHGCYFHGCPQCYNDLTINRCSDIYMYKLYENTEKINSAIKNAGYNLELIWEHDFDKNKKMRNVAVDEYDLVEPMNIRDSFYGGRCEPIKLMHNFINQKGRYIDVVSLYPTVMYYDKYPVGHPIKIMKPKEYDYNWFGFIYCKVLPPRDLYQPVLPYKQKAKQGHKLLFGLCRTCMMYIDLKCIHYKNTKCSTNCTTKNCSECRVTRKLMKETCSQCYNIRNGECFHSDDERVITGVWCTNEIEKALEKGYQVVYIYEVQHFDNTSDNLWKGYIKKFMKIKLETSQFECTEDEYRRKARKLGIELEKLEYNPGLRFISKICLNSLWGKFGQVPKHKQHKYIDTEVDFYKTVLDDKIESLSLSFLNDLTVYASYDLKDQFVKNNYNTNIYVACFTTAWARLRLYDMIDKIGRNVCYMDTDSIVYVEDETNKYIFDQYIGDSLGEWTDELNGKYIEFWACAQSKDYGYIMNDGNYKGKVKGFRVTGETEEKMNHQARVDLIRKGLTVDIKYNQFTIKNNQIFTKELIKQWGFQFDKRRIVRISDDDIHTLPYGY